MGIQARHHTYGRMAEYRAREKVTQKMTREGAVEVNAATGKKKRISNRIRDADLTRKEAHHRLDAAKAEKAATFVARRPAGVCIAVAAGTEEKR